MKIRFLPGAAMALLLACSFSISAQDRGYWNAASSNSKAITGDIAIGSGKVTIYFSSFPLASVRILNTDEVAAAFDADVNAGGNGQLYRLNVPADKRFLHHNTLCGTEKTQWMATFVSGRDLQVAFFSGSNPPVLTVEALANSTDVCGTFTYAR